MNCIDRMEGLILRLPVIVETSESIADFWRRVDGSMGPILESVGSEAERIEVNIRYEDLVEMANALGMIRADDQRVPHRGV